MLLSLDVETRSAQDLRRVGVTKYAQDSSTSLLCACFGFPDGRVVRWWRGEALPKEVAAALRDPDTKVYAWNASFERAIWEALCVPMGWPALTGEQWVCTAALAARCALPRSLDEAAKALQLPMKKDREGHRLMLLLCRPRATGVFREPTAEERERLLAYCERDVQVETAIRKALPNVSSEFERAIWLLDQRINCRGMLIDLPFVRNSLKIVTEELQRLNAELQRLTDGKVVSVFQTHRFHQWLRSQGVVAQSLDREHVRDLLRVETLPAVVREALLLRAQGAKSSVAKLKQMLVCVGQDGRIRDMLLYHAATTGRWAGRGVQPQNFPRPEVPVKPFYDAIYACDRTQIAQSGLSVMQVMASALRSCFIAAPGHEFIGADFNAIEARGLAWLAGATKLLNAFQHGSRVYAEMGAVIFNKTPEEVEEAHEKKTVPLWRWLGKTVVLGCGYQMGAATLQRNVKKFGDLLLPLRLCQRAVDAYRNEHWQIPRLWKNIFDAAVYAVQETRNMWVPVEQTQGKLCFLYDGTMLQMRLPSGRTLWYHRPEIEQQELPWSTPDRRVFGPALSVEGIDPTTKKWSRFFVFGGLLTENAVQAIARDLLAEAMLRVEKAGCRVVLTVHDEVITENPVNMVSVSDFQTLMVQLPAWAQQFPLAVSAWRGSRWEKD